MRKIILKVFLFSSALLLTSCNIAKKLFYEEVGKINKNNCGILVFRDSIQYNLVYDYLEYQQEAYENSSNYSTATDEEKPLTDFEILKQHNSYRTLIKNQEDIAENNGVDLSVNPVPEILEDDAILQTLLNQERMIVINDIVYFYFDDCTLFKFPVGKCEQNIKKAKEYLSKYDYNLQNQIKPPFNFEKIDICNDEINFKSVSQCQVAKIEFCEPDQCQSKYVDIIISYPNYNQTEFLLTNCEIIIDGFSTNLNVNNASLIQANTCGLSLNSYGFSIPKYFPNYNTNHSVIVKSKFKYYTNGVEQICEDQISKTLTIESPCKFKYENIQENNFTVTVTNVYNPCKPGIGQFSFDTSNGNPTVTYPNANSVQAKYSCAGEKIIKVTNNDPNCSKTDEIKVYPKDPSLCCDIHTKYRKHCDKVITSLSGNNRIRVVLRERNNRIVAVIRNFHLIRNRFKRGKSTFDCLIDGNLYFYKNTCSCLGEFGIEKTKGVTARKFKIKYKLSDRRSQINTACSNGFNWFKKNWSRKNETPWKLTVTGNSFNKEIFKINCSNQSDTCNQ